jgi:hypothetical protein
MSDQHPPLLQVPLNQLEEPQDLILGQMIELLFGDDAIVGIPIAGQEAKRPRRPAVELPVLSVRYLVGEWIDAQDVNILLFPQQIDEVAGTATDDENTGVARRRDVAKVVATVKNREACISPLDVRRRFPEGIKRLDLRRQTSGHVSRVT